MEVTIYSDGAAYPNPGRGGYGAVILYPDRRVELSAGFVRTTNNRMEILGALTALESLTAPANVRLYSDSKYLVQAVNVWVYGWERRGWSRKEGALLNGDLWRRVYVAVNRHKVKALWVKGHSGIEGNERADWLASQAAYYNGNLQVDEGFSDQRSRQRDFLKR